MIPSSAAPATFNHKKSSGLAIKLRSFCNKKTILRERRTSGVYNLAKLLNFGD